jgi:predicted nucleic acid-binding protein
MTDYLDTPILVFACANATELGDKARELIAASPHPVTTPHALAECFNALTYRLGIPPAAARKLMQKNFQRIRFENLDSADYLAAINEVVDNGQTGDKIYDALHLRAAGNAKADKIHTSNKRDFSAFSPVMEVVKLA